MKISPQWVREFVDLKVDDRQLAEELTMHGIAVEGIEHVGTATVYEVEFTSNRPDAMNHYGVARECSAIFDIELRPLLANLPAMTMAASAGADWDPRPDKKDEKKKSVARDAIIRIEDPQGCARYTGRIIRGVTIGPSPETVVERLKSVEQRSISNVADATNYVLWEMGHPTHAFDLDRLEGGCIVVRRARPGETLETLDGVERKLGKDDLVIADAVKPVALAGIMGGASSAISATTRNVLIEAAWFDPVSVRRTAKRHGMHTDASHRFERGADFNATSLACSRVCQLILASAGGKLDGPEIDAVGRQVLRPSLHLRHSEVQRILGKELSADEILRILCPLGFAVAVSRPAIVVGAPSLTLVSGGAHAAVAEEPPAYAVDVPGWRLDIEREIDVIEEVARIHGYNRFENTLPPFSGAVVETPDAHKDTRLRRSLLALGYNEAMSWTFIDRAEASSFTSGEVLPLENPISEEASVMRTSLVPGMLAMLAWNLNHGTTDVRLFEAGHVFEKVGERVDERKRLCWGATGQDELSNWDRRPRPSSFFDMKGDVETLLAAFACRSLYYDSLSADFFHPGRSARAVMDGTTVARFGQLHPDWAAARKLRQDVFIGELYLDRLYRHELRAPQYRPVPRFPAVERDFSFVFADEVTFERLRTAVEALQLGALRRFAPVEIFRGESVPAGKYSVLLRATFQSAERTLRDEEVAGWTAQIVERMKALGGNLRG